MPQLRNLVVSEVSFCRKGHNPHSRIALFKSADKTPLGIAKATFQEALDAQLVSQRVQNAFYGCFDNLWSRNDAFRTAMTDELAAGGDGSVAAEAWVASVKELADNAVAAAKENGGKPTDAELTGAMEKAVATYLEKSNQKEPTTMAITTKAALLAAIAKFDPSKSTVGEQQEILTAATTLGEEASLPVAGPLAKAAQPTDVSKLEREITLLKMAEPVRKHFNGLDAAGQTAFLALDDAARTAAVEKANATDPVVHKCADGTEIRKSDGALAVTMAKRMDKLEAENAALSKATQEGTVEKAAGRFPNVAKSVVARLLKTAEGGTEADVAEVEQTLTAMNKSAGGAFKTLGNGGDPLEKSADTAQGKMDAIVDRIAKSQNISKAAATLAAQADPDFQEAYRQSVSNPTPADAE